MFDRGEAASVLVPVDVQPCSRGDGPTGPGHVTVTFSPSGIVTSAVSDQPPYLNTPVGECVAAKFRSVHMTPFAGAPVKVGKAFVIR
jgi:hypothetical protein